MSSTNKHLPKLHQCLHDELTAMSSLTEVLKLEEGALIDGNVEKLNKLTIEKSKLIADISTLENERKICLEQQGYSSDAKGMQDYFAKYPSETAATNDWATLLQISEKAKECNRTNGLLINRQFVRNQSALNALQQKSPAESMYGPTGHSTNNATSGRRVIAS